MGYGNYSTTQFQIGKNLANPNTRFWGIWLPVPTILAIIVTFFFNWLIIRTVGYVENRIEKAGQHIIEGF